jgi:mRNA interferase HigB
VNVVSRRGLLAKAKSLKVDAATSGELRNWFQVASRARWTSLKDVREVFPSADRVGQTLIFNIHHNSYRLIVRHEFPWQRLFVKALLTHKEYDRREWLKWS